MKKILVITALLFVASNSWAVDEEHKVCEITAGKKSVEGLEMCNKGDNLLIFLSRRTERFYRNRIIASNCELDTITILETESSVNSIGPYIVLCEYNGKSLEISKP